MERWMLSLGGVDADFQWGRQYHCKDSSFFHKNRKCIDAETYLGVDTSLIMYFTSSILVCELRKKP